jgi:hypothetical protein
MLVLCVHRACKHDVIILPGPHHCQLTAPPAHHQSSIHPLQLEQQAQYTDTHTFSPLAHLPLTATTTTDPGTTTLQIPGSQDPLPPPFLYKMAPPASQTPVGQQHPPVNNPDTNNPIQKVAAPLATISSHSDPWPHYFMSGACEWLVLQGCWSGVHGCHSSS